jgi:hypothetical protein
LNVVCDASTLIALARIGQLDILVRVGARVMIPRAVYEEVVVKGRGKPGVDEIRDASWSHAALGVPSGCTSISLVQNSSTSWKNRIAVAGSGAVTRV